MFRKTTISLAIATLIGINASAQAGSQLFADEFDGDELGAHWEVLNEDPDTYIVEDGSVLSVATGQGNLAKGTATNIFRLKNELPKGDWVATMQFRMPYQTGREAVYLGVYDDKDNHITATFGAWSYYEGTRGARMYLYGGKVLKGKGNHSSNVVWGGASGVAFSEEEAPNPFVLRITKKGRTYTPAIRLANGSEQTWHEYQTVTLLRPKGGLSFGILQQQKVNGETPLIVDYVRIESLDD